VTALDYHLRELAIARDRRDPRRVMPAIEPRHRRILDLGGGAGQTLIASTLAPGTRAVCADLDLAALALGRRLEGRALRFVAARGERLPFADGAFDLVTSRHPVTIHWSEITRVLARGGTYFAQHVGGGTNVEISEHFLGPLDPGDGRHHEVEADQARASGLEIVQCRNERLALEFFDVGAMVFFLRKVVWTVPDFSVDRYRAQLRDLHDQIEQDGVFRSTMSRTLLEARKPPVS
jgi:SAM-dependent methyltransferase